MPSRERHLCQIGGSTRRFDKAPSLPRHRLTLGPSSLGIQLPTWKFIHHLEPGRVLQGLFSVIQRSCVGHQTVPPHGYLAVATMSA